MLLSDLKGQPEEFEAEPDAGSHPRPKWMGAAGFEVGRASERAPGAFGQKEGLRLLLIIL